MSGQWIGLCIGAMLMWTRYDALFDMKRLIEDNESVAYNHENVGNDCVAMDEKNEPYDKTTPVDKIIVEEQYVMSEYELQEIIKETIEMTVSKQDSTSYIPKGTKLNKAIVLDHALLLDFSRELLGYGGTDWERGLTHQLLNIAFSFKEINAVTIAIDGEVENLVEGTLINGYTREKWEKEK